MLIGILAGLATGALWGLTFVAPRAVAPFSAWDLTVLRYGIFGGVSLLLMLHPRFRPTGLRPRQITLGLLLGAGGYVSYFVSVAWAVRLAGAVIPPLIIGTMPVLLPVIANLRRPAHSWRALALPLLLIAAGLVTVNIAAFTSAGAAGQDDILLGILCAGVGLAIWVVYGIVNAAAMEGADRPDALGWTGLQGIGAALGSLPLLPFTSLGGIAPAGLEAGHVGRFLAWALVMGLAGSWLGTWFWVVAARRLPLALAAQLIVTETVFGLFYGFLFEARWPLPVEWLGTGLQVVGVALAVDRLGRAQAGIVPSA